MPLQLTFHLELAQPSSIVATWSEAESRLIVRRITGAMELHRNRLVQELRKHAIEAGYQLPPYLTHPSADENHTWSLLARYNRLPQGFMRDEIDNVLSEIFHSLRIEHSSELGVNRPMSDIRIFIQKPDGTNTKAWVWKDSIRWISTEITP